MTYMHTYIIHTYIQMHEPPGLQAVLCGRGGHLLQDERAVPPVCRSFFCMMPQSPETRDQRPEPRTQTPEIRAQRPEPKVQRSEPRAQRPEVPRRRTWIHGVWHDLESPASLVVQSPVPRAQSPEFRAQSPRPQSPRPQSPHCPEPRSQSPEPRVQSYTTPGRRRCSWTLCPGDWTSSCSGTEVF